MELPKALKRTDKSLLRPKILLLSDDLTTHSGIATMSYEFVINTLDKFQWVQLAALKRHINHGKVADLSSDVAKISGVEDASLKLYMNSGYGNPDLLREIIRLEKPDVILHFTDPRFWGWLYRMQYELHHEYNIPIAYYSIWDNYPTPYYNIGPYGSCDLLMAINTQTHGFHREILNHYGIDICDVNDIKNYTGKEKLVDYIPHGIDENVFKPLSVEDNEDYKIFVENFKKGYGKGPVFLWNNRNIQRKHPSTVIEAFKIFVDKLNSKGTLHKDEQPILIMHTDVQDPNGTDLVAVKRVIAPDCNIIFSTEALSKEHLNFYYNLAIATINVASNEGFGLSSLESIMAGTQVINNDTGGLRDQIDGNWAYVVSPSNRTIQGSLATPYIYDDRVCAVDLAYIMERLLNNYLNNKDKFKKCGLDGREWAINESGMTSKNMANDIAHALQTLINNWQVPEKVTIEKIGNYKKIKN